MLRISRHYISPRRAILLVGDLVVFWGAAYAAMAPRTVGLMPLWHGHGPLYPKAAAFSALLVLLLALGDFYGNGGRIFRRTELFARLLMAFGVAVVVAGASNYLFPTLRFSRGAFLLAFPLAFLGAFAWRILLLRVVGGQKFRERVAILGTEKPAQMVLDEVLGRTHPEVEILGMIHAGNGQPRPAGSAVPILGTTRDLLDVCRDQRADSLVIAVAERRGSLPIQEIVACKLAGVRVEDWPNFLERFTGKIHVGQLRPSWLIFSDGFRRPRLFQAVKRGADFAIAATLLCLAAPVMALVALAIKLDSPGSIVFRQERVGQNGRIFTLRKFRSMRQDAEVRTGPVWAGPLDPRVTRVGRLLRKARLDELPQLWNVLCGEMSFVGPRPERPFFVAQLRKAVPFYEERLAVRPGITGWAQVRYRYGSSLEDAIEKLQYDLYYIKNMSLFLDLVILAATVRVVLFGRGAR
jgi:sugar transferase (PEP-CTERM system associated)